MKDYDKSMQIIDIILDLIYPPKCAFCRKLLNDNEKGCCKACERKLPRVPEGKRSDAIKNVSTCIVPLYYRDDVRDSMRRYKFGGLTGYKNVYADFLAKSIDENGISCDIITWAPISRKRLRKRGYDQTKLIAKALSYRLGVPCKRTLAKTHDNPPQSSLSDSEQRKSNVSGVYFCTAPEVVKGKRVMIVDDIVTSGATFAECAKVLKNAGAAEILAAAVATAH